MTLESDIEGYKAILNLIINVEDDYFKEMVLHFYRNNMHNKEVLLVTNQLLSFLESLLDEPNKSQIIRSYDQFIREYSLSVYCMCPFTIAFEASHITNFGFHNACYALIVEDDG